METECVHESHHQGNARAQLDSEVKSVSDPTLVLGQETVFSLPWFSSDRESASLARGGSLQPGEGANGLCSALRGQQTKYLLLPLVPPGLSSANPETFAQTQA